MVDSIDGVKIVVNEDVDQDIDMSRKEYIDKLTPDQKRQLEELKKHNSEAMKANEVIKALNADLKVVTQDVKDADTARQTATQQLGATRPPRRILKPRKRRSRRRSTPRFETLMTKDTAAKPDAAVLWAQLGLAQAGLKKYDDAETSFKKALEVDTDSKKPSPAGRGHGKRGAGRSLRAHGQGARGQCSL